MSNLAR